MAGYCASKHAVQVVVFVCTAGPRLSESPLSEPLVIRTLFRILNPKGQLYFLQSQVINEMPV